MKRLITLTLIITLFSAAFLNMSGMQAADENPPLLLAAFEGSIGYTADDYYNQIGLVSWGDTTGNIVLNAVAADGDLVLPDQVGANTVLSITYDIAGYGGFSHVLTDGMDWLPQDWTRYATFDFWLYGANSGGEIQVEIFDNRAPESATDTAERWYYRIVDDVTGWRFFSLPFAYFQRRTDWQPAGAPDDGLGLTEVHGYAFSFPAGVGSRTNYLDNVAVSGPLHYMPAAVQTSADPAPYNAAGDWQLVWSDEFEAVAGTPLDARFWTCEQGGHGWGNDQLEYNTSRLVNVAQTGDSNLAITAREENYQANVYTSARCNTMDKIEFTYGKVEARIKLPEGQGIWPAFWMLGASFPGVSWPDTGEIDIMEYIGAEPFTVYGTIHGPGYSGTDGLSMPYNTDVLLADDYHVFGIEWEPDVIRWYIDGELFHTVTAADLDGLGEWVYDHDFYVIINVAVGGTWPGSPDDTTVFPQQMLIDWVRVYQRN
ncbi:MAG: family 16 glycosylhydrolase [Anaerolineae bacterium]|nr:family 16 glycosylhydrolase [Anaerolineae bacterium]